MDPEWTDPAWIAYGLTCLAGWGIAWKLLPDDKVVPGGHVHDLHAIGATILGVLSMAELLPEMAVLHFASTYFLADTLHSVYHRKWQMFVAHHIPAMMLFGSQPLMPRLRALKWASRLLMIEVTTPFLTRWRRSKRKDHFQQFMLMFFLVRVVYLSYQLYVFLGDDVGGYPAQIAGVVLTAVNIYWFFTQSKMLLNYREKGAADTPKQDKTL